jgi:predicted DNA-binding transcriptional regulator YafY
MLKYDFSEMIRRTEILARIMNGESHSKADLAGCFNVTEITINRDLKWLRDCGIQIYSMRGTVKLLKFPDDELLNHMAADYLPVVLNSGIYLKQVKLLSKLNSNKSFEFLVLLAKAVYERLIIRMKYTRLSDDTTHEYELKPYRLFADRLNWQLQAIKNGESIIKTFYLSRIESISLTEKNFNEITADTKTDKIYKMKFKFPEDLEKEVIDKIWFEEYEIQRPDDGSLLLITEQPVTNSLAAWCISWWDKIEILGPPELLVYAKDMMHSFSEINY